MLDALKTAGYFADKYKKVFGKEIDEMKLHKLLYFFLRECYVDKIDPDVAITFEARQYGPVSLDIRYAYKHQLAYDYPSADELASYESTLERVFRTYAPKSSWSLSSLTHGEISWTAARKRFEAGADATLDLEDIKRDATRIRLRRYLLNGKVS